MKSHPGESRYSYYVFFVLLAILCGWILSLPIFPTQDGPVHVYYADVAASLIKGSPLYAADFHIARPFPPYSLHAYILMALLQVVSPAMAEKLLACVAVLVLGLGMLYLARQVGPSGGLAAAFAAPLLLNRYLFLGFYGFCIAVGLAFAAMGLWLRPDRGEIRRRVLFLVLVVICLFSHPVPFLLLLGFCWSETLAGWWLGKETNRGSGFISPGRSDVAALLASTALLLYIKHYSHSGALWTPLSRSELQENVYRIADTFLGYLLSPLTTVEFRWPMAAIFAAALVLAVWRALRDAAARRFTRSHLLLGWALAMTFALPLAPGEINGSYFFADRLALWIALLVLVAAAAIEISPRVEKPGSLVALVLGIALLGPLNAQVRPVARALDIFNFPPLPAGEHLLAFNRMPDPGPFTLNPFLWSAVRVVEREHAILENSPWLELQIMMLEQRPATVTLAGRVFPQPNRAGPPIAAGVVMTECGNLRSTASLGTQMLEEARGQLRLWRAPCYELLAPATPLHSP